MARRGYPPEFRRRVVELVESGRNTRTDPNSADSDDDGWDDGAEVWRGTDPNDLLSAPGILPAMERKP